MLMEKTDPDDEEKERQSDFKQWTEDLDKQIQLAKDFLKRKESDGRIGSHKKLVRAVIRCQGSAKNQVGRSSFAILIQFAYAIDTCGQGEWGWRGHPLSK